MEHLSLILSIAASLITIVVTISQCKLKARVKVLEINTINQTTGKGGNNIIEKNNLKQTHSGTGDTVGGNKHNY